MAVHPATEDDAILFVSLLHDGYHASVAHRGAVTFSDTSDEDQLALTVANGERWVEQAGSESTIRSTLISRDDIRQAESPMVSPDGPMAGVSTGGTRPGTNLDTLVWIRTKNRTGSSLQQSSTCLRCRFCLEVPWCLRRHQGDHRPYFLRTRQAKFGLLTWTMQGILLSLRTVDGLCTVSFREGTGTSGCAT